MTSYSPKLDANRLLQLSEEVSRISSSLAQLSLGREHAHAEATEPEPAAIEVTEEMVRWIINARNLRSRFLPSDLFADPAWDMLLELLRSELAHQRIQVSSLCLAANAPATTALRYIKSMVKQGMVLRKPDAFDARRVHITLAPETSTALRSYCASLFKKPIPGIACKVA